MHAVEINNMWKGFRRYQDKAMGLKERIIFWGQEKVDVFWALKDINLVIPQGATVGLIGRNGSGKSTLLKTISKILYPTKGKIKVTGRMSTLLELGAGFHQDFTGRENIYLNASILGLSRKEIERHIDSIIDFAELSEFIDTPVRNYSSGMYMRLGFAIAVHVDPDILLIDEVLAVGDLAFQEKCFKKLKDFQNNGKTIIFVTHSPNQLEGFCDFAVWLDHGEIKMQGPTQDTIQAYTEFMVSL